MKRLYQSQSFANSGMKIQQTNNVMEQPGVTSGNWKNKYFQVNKMGSIIVLLSALFVLPLTGGAQVRIVNSIIGTYIGGASLPYDNIPATDALLFGADGIAVDASGNLYVSDYGSHKLRIVSGNDGYIHTIAGTGTLGFSGDGGPATAAMLSQPGALCMDKYKNIYVSDEGNARIRKISSSTHNITTVAGGGASTADGVPAVSASIGAAKCVATDTAGTLHIIDSSGTVRRINLTTGLIYTVPGMPAASWMTFDRTNNIYFSSGGLIQKRNEVSGLITTLGGGGVLTTDGVPATSANLTGYSKFCIDTAGNVYIGNGSLIKEIDAATGQVGTVAGCGGSYYDGIPAIDAYAGNYLFCTDNYGNVYYSNNVSNVRKMSLSFPGMVGYSIDSFNVSINKLCNGPELTFSTNHYASGQSIKTWFGDGQSATVSLVAGCSVSGGYAVLDHTYNAPGTYTIKMVLYIGTTPVDSMHRTYNYVFCNTIPVKFYYDADSNCSKGANEPYIFLPILTEVDSNGVAIDTIAATNGLNYTAFGNPGDVYRFRPFSWPAGLHVTCPASGVISDTLTPLLYNLGVSQFGMTTTGSGAKDLQVFTSFRAGRHHFGGDIIVDNTFGAPSAAVLTAQPSPKYTNAFGSNLLPSSIAGNSYTWLLNLTATPSAPQHITMDLEVPGAWNIAGDTAGSNFAIGPLTGDVNPADNDCGRNDTIISSYDPNYMDVSPRCLPTDKNTLTYTIHFQNTGNDTAFNVYVLDTLAAYMNPRSMKIVAASAAMDISMLKSGGCNIVKFNFPDINLLDSAHTGYNSGMVIFSINVSTPLSGMNMFNKAGIYFDGNPVVMTNVAENSTGCIDKTPIVQNPELAELYPNPAANELTITTTGSAYTSFVINNGMGQALIQQALTGGETKVNIQSLPAGLYYVSLQGEHGTVVKKFVKM